MALFFLTDIPYTVYFLASDWGRAISWQVVLACAALSYLLIKLGMKIIEHHTIKRQVLRTIKVFLGEEDVSFEALVDTGHSLKEPLSRSPVIIAEFEHIKNILPDSLKKLFYEKLENDYAGLISLGEGNPFYKRIRMIPFTSIGKKSGMLIGFKPDRIVVGDSENGSPEDVVIGIYNDKLCSNSRYQGLLSPEIC